MVNTLRQLLLQCLHDSRATRSADPAAWPQQILCLSDAIIFTERCEDAIGKGPH